MRSKLACVVVFAVLIAPLASCQATNTEQIPVDASVVPFQLSAPQLTAVKDGVAKRLKDPESARFGVVVASKSSTIWVCGYVNAKNSFGGYPGEQLFIGGLLSMDTEKGQFNSFSLSGIASDEIELNVTREMCASKGIII